MTHPTRDQILAALAKHVTITLEHEPEWCPYDSGPLARTGECAAEDIAWIERELDKGNPWAWCSVTVRAEWCGLVAEDHLGGCSYESEAEFRAPGGYFDDMVSSALDALAERVFEIHREAEMLVLDAMARVEVTP